MDLRHLVRAQKGQPPKYTVCTAATHPGSPSVGDRLYETDTGMDLIYQGSTVGWRMPWGLPWGSVAAPTVSTTFSQAVTVGTTDLTGLNITWTALANRIYRVTFSGAVVVQTTANSVCKIFITDSSNNVVGLGMDFVLAVASAVGSRSTAPAVAILTGLSAGSTTYKMRCTTTASTSTVQNDSGMQVLMTVEDIGPNGNPS